MLYSILAIITVVVFLVLLVKAIMEENYSSGISDAFSSLLGCAALTVIILGVCGIFNMGSPRYGEKIETSEIYVLAEKSYIGQKDNRLEFIYVDGHKVPQKFEEYVNEITVLSGESNTVEVTTIRYEQGTWMFPWGMSHTEKTATIR